jgi:hypothetical protein
LYGRGGCRKKVIKRMIDDLCGLLRCNKKDAYRVVSTPACMGGLGYYGITKIDKLMKIDGDEATEIAGRMVRTTQLNKDAQKQMLNNLSEKINTSYEDGMIVTEGIVKGIKNKQEIKEKSRYKIVEVNEKIDLMRNIQQENVIKIKRPKNDIDPMFLSGLLRDKIKGGLEGVLELYSEDHRLISLMWKKMPRSIFFDWLCGTEKIHVGKRFGDAGDVIGLLNKEIKEGGIYPTGKITVEKMKRTRISLEFLSSCRRIDLRNRFRS